MAAVLKWVHMLHGPAAPNVKQAFCLFFPILFVCHVLFELLRVRGGTQQVFLCLNLH